MSVFSFQKVCLTKTFKRKLCLNALGIGGANVENIEYQSRFPVVILRLNLKGNHLTLCARNTFEEVYWGKVFLLSFF